MCNSGGWDGMASFCHSAIKVMRSRMILLMKGRQVIVRVQTNSLDNLAEKPCPDRLGFEPENIVKVPHFVVRMLTTGLTTGLSGRLKILKSDIKIIQNHSNNEISEHLKYL